MAYKMAVIGSGMMGRAIIAGVIRNKVIQAADIYTADIDPKKTAALHDELGTTPAVSNIEAVEDADIILLSVKPQFLDGVLNELDGQIPEDALLLSIVVGVPMGKICDALGHERIIRIMPNTPAQVGEGVSAWIASPAVSSEQKKLAIDILSGLGLTVPVTKESDLDLVTALSGSGPAYVFLFIEAMIDTAVQMGMARKTAEKLAVQTVKGSAAYMAERGEHPAVLRNEVTSPGGTTAEAIYYLEKGGLRTAVAQAMWGCYERTLDLGEGKKRIKGPEA